VSAELTTSVTDGESMACVRLSASLMREASYSTIR
jgi:hypothetical protein